MSGQGQKNRRADATIAPRASVAPAGGKGDFFNRMLEPSASGFTGLRTGEEGISSVFFYKPDSSTDHLRRRVTSQEREELAAKLEKAMEEICMRTYLKLKRARSKYNAVYANEVLKAIIERSTREVIETVRTGDWGCMRGGLQAAMQRNRERGIEIDTMLEFAAIHRHVISEAIGDSRRERRMLELFFTTQSSLIAKLYIHDYTTTESAMLDLLDKTSSIPINPLMRPIVNSKSVSTMGLNALFKEIASRMAELARADVCEVWVRETDAIHCVATWGMTNHRPPLKLNESITGAVVESGEAIFGEDLQFEQRWKKSIYPKGERNRLRGFMELPLVYTWEDGYVEVIGTISFASRRTGAFSEENVDLLSQYSKLITMTIQGARLQKALEYSSQHDPLTELYNRMYGVAYLDREMGESCRREGPFSLLFIDIDHFKRINDEKGHVAGDITLKHVARVAKKTCRENDIACRWGGEEFLVVMPGADQKKALKTASDILESVRKDIPGVTVSVGVATKQLEQSPEDLLRLADELMYFAKGKGDESKGITEDPNGRNRVAYKDVYTDELRFLV